MRVAFAWCLLIGVFVAGPVRAQQPAQSILFYQYRQFRIPFNPTANDRNIKQLQLFVSTDQGKTWSPSAIAAPDQRFFNFAADRDGYFWFTVQVTDLQDRTFPQSLEGAQPSLRVVVDTQQPVIELKSLTPRGNEIGVSWSLRDENIDLALPDSMRLEYRIAGALNWVVVPLPVGVSQHYWNPGFNGPVEVKLRARDRAGNIGTQTVVAGAQPGHGGFNPGSGVLSGGNSPGSFASGGNGFSGSGAPSGGRNLSGYSGLGDVDRQFVNSKRLSFDYELKDVGKSDISYVELWYTTDGRSWNKYNVRYRETKDQKDIVFLVDGEGIYGFTLIAKSGVGLGPKPPQVGEKPQIWIEVDLTKPEVDLRDVIVHTGTESGKMTLAWTASDRNLAATPITLSYAADPNGPWTKIAENLPMGQGRYTWQMPPNVPFQFHVRVEASDKAGNIGQAMTREMVKVDLAIPKVQIRKVQPAGN